MHAKMQTHTEARPYSLQRTYARTVNHKVEVDAGGGPNLKVGARPGAGGAQDTSWEWGAGTP